LTRQRKVERNNDLYFLKGGRYYATLGGGRSILLSYRSIVTIALYRKMKALSTKIPMEFPSNSASFFSPSCIYCGEWFERGEEIPCGRQVILMQIWKIWSLIKTAAVPVNGKTRQRPGFSIYFCVFYFTYPLF